MKVVLKVGKPGAKAEAKIRMWEDGPVVEAGKKVKEEIEALNPSSPGSRKGKG